ncbi:SpoIID/LytB domain-containing protein [Synechococcus sp. CCY 9618]|uniref:SpoIID/LytB domain-containing protein n=1 Tax=Synechococcus sp. CCY 9618 TaxID=2815602 RepID=UPI00352D5D65
MSLLRLGWRAGLPLALLPAALASPPPLQAIAPEPMVRVLLQEAPSLELEAGSAPLRLGDGKGRTLLEIPPGEGLELRRSGSALEARLLGRAGTPRRVSLPLQQAWIDPAPARGRSGEALLTLQQRRYRGRLLVRQEGDRLQAINLIDVESYLPSVVGSEMPATWPQAALRAQAVAARTYALRQRRPAAPFDLKATVASQVYKGVEAETDSTREAVRSTRSQVLVHGAGLINAVFHSSSGGLTENSGEIWRQQLPYLVSVTDFDEASPVHAWQLRIEADQLAKAFREIGGAFRIDLLATTSSGRIRQAKVTGPGGSLLLSGAELRQRLGLRSTMARFAFEAPSRSYPFPPPLPALPGVFGPGVLESVAATLVQAPWLAPRPPAAPALVVNGRGFGHGVGMSQWGAYGLALRGEDYREILRHYYQGARILPYSSL